MYAEERQQAIADEVRRIGRASVADLAGRFSVTSETVRRIWPRSNAPVIYNASTVVLCGPASSASSPSKASMSGRPRTSTASSR